MPSFALRREGAREAVWLALGLWGTAFAVYLLPSAADGDMPAYAYGMFAVMACYGLLPSFCIYHLIRFAGGLKRSAAARFAVIVLGLVATGAVHSLGETLTWQAFADRFAPEKHLPPFAVGVASNFLVLFWLHSLYAAGLGLVLSNQAMRKREAQLNEARALAHQAQVAALRFQLNPHFLFNTLNAVSTLVVTGRNAEAEAMIGRLCEFLRVSFAADPNAVTPLAEELATVEAYLEIESVRFGERLQVEVLCPPELETALAPGLILQPLVENAVKYGVATSRRKVKVRVEAATAGEDLKLLVEDDGDAANLPADHAGTGVGLENARRRLTALYGERAGLEAGRLPGGGWRTALWLPLERAEDKRRAA